jgi:hypothetical protein
MASAHPSRQMSAKPRCPFSPSGVPKTIRDLGAEAISCAVRCVPDTGVQDKKLFIKKL